MTGETPPVKNALEILPLEVWSKVFDELESPTDLESCFRTCRDWMTFLEQKSSQFLMPKVFPLICKHLALKMENEDDEDSDESSQEEGTPTPNPILSTRLVCKSWKYAVDSFLQNHPSHTNIEITQIEEDPDPSQDIEQLPIKHYEFGTSNVDELENLVETDFPSDCNPFLTRYLQYSEHNGDGTNLRRRLRNAFTNLLSLHGTHVWHVSFSMKLRRRRKTKDYNLVHRYLSLMPNLKTLDMDFNKLCSSSYLRRLTPSHEQLLVANPLPKLEHLTTLKMRSVPALILKGILLRNNHIQKLRLLRDSIAASAATLPNLQMDMLEEFTTDVKLETDLLTLQSLSWPFKKLSIRSQNLPLDPVFGAITASRFANNLKHLIVDVDDDDGGVHNLTAKLELPNLITFQITVDDMRLKSIDFLLPTSASLSSLHIEMDADQEPIRSMTTRSMKKKSSNQVVQFYDYIPNMLESYIWKHFPELKRLKIGIYNPIHCGGKPDDNHFKYEYARQDWQKCLKNQSK